MWKWLPRQLIPIIVALLATSGLSFAATSAFQPADTDPGASTTAGDPVQTEEPEETERPDETDEAEEVSTEEVVTTEALEKTDDPDAGDATDDKPRSTEGCPDGFEGNHGQFVSGTEDRPRSEAAHSDCGKPVHADHEDKGHHDDGDVEDGEHEDGEHERSHDRHHDGGDE